MTGRLHLITLNLARNAEFPAGSDACGYEIFAPLDAGRHLDPQAWHDLRDRCSVRHFWRGENDKFGMLRHRAGGAHGARWCIHYGAAGGGDDETGFHLDTHVFREGEYVSIADTEGDVHTFRVTKVVPVMQAAAHG